MIISLLGGFLSGGFMSGGLLSCSPKKQLSEAETSNYMAKTNINEI